MVPDRLANECENPKRLVDQVPARTVQEVSRASLAKRSQLIATAKWRLGIESDAVLQFPNGLTPIGIGRRALDRVQEFVAGIAQSHRRLLRRLHQPGRAAADAIDEPGDGMAHVLVDPAEGLGD